MSDTKISALPAASTPLTGSEVVPLNQSGVTSNVTVANLTAGRNITFNNTLPGYTTTATAAGTTTLTSSSTYHQRFTGSSAQTIVLPNATTMAQGQGFIIDNDSSATLTLQDGSTASLGSVTPGMAVYVFCENNSTTAGSWSGYMFVPGSGPSGQVTWGTAGLSMGGQTITNATWNATTIGTAYGGTGLTSFTANGVVYASSTSALNNSSNLQFDGTNLLVGTSSTSGSISNTSEIVGGVFTTVNGSVSAANNTTVTLATLPSVNNGTWIVTGALIASAVQFSCVYIINTQNASTQATALVSSGTLSISVTGTLLQAKQTVGTTYTITWTAFRIA